MSIDAALLDRATRDLSDMERQRDELVAALKAIVATDFLRNEAGVRQAIPVRWNRALEIAAAAIEKAEGR